MNEELAYRTIAYLIGCYKNNDETTINQEEIDAINFILNENQQLKEQLNKKYENVGTLTSEILYEENTKLINQQKEFINYLESESKELIRDAGYHQRICLEILEKYKKIIGGKHE
ncbi:MAG TPA: hypothetical protein IAB59_00200 [Candidatus Onthousia faecipullorum]|uniref:Uncharacterized protein n=1 Tax=Candidatus Onthousia faecipullorum TaxID=2840887 RepID=A0A9D1G9R2_9FIRM|nr:hypothetical protein [Candidatus Onthousia faecipullorum]